MDITAAYDAFFGGREEAWVVCETLRKALASRWPQTRLRVMKTCIAFDDPKPYAYVSFPPRKGMGGLWLSISLSGDEASGRIAMTVPVSKTRTTAHIHLPDAGAVDEELLALIAKAHR